MEALCIRESRSVTFFCEYLPGNEFPDCADSNSKTGTVFTGEKCLF